MVKFINDNLFKQKFTKNLDSLTYFSFGYSPHVSFTDFANAALTGGITSFEVVPAKIIHLLGFKIFIYYH